MLQIGLIVLCVLLAVGAVFYVAATDAAAVQADEVQLVRGKVEADPTERDAA